MLRVFVSWRMAVVLLLGFSSGIPLGLSGDTLKAWMKTENVDLTVIGVFSLVSLPYALKFLWSPLVDRFVPPLLGRRRGWMLLAQLAVAAMLVPMAMTSPSRQPLLMASLAMLVAFFSATQDIAIDAYRTELLTEEELGAGASLYTLGYRLAMIVSGGLALILADHMSWGHVYLIMAACMAVGVAAAVLAPEPRLDVVGPTTLRQAVVQPFVEFVRRHGPLVSFEIVLFVLIYKLDVMMAQGMLSPFLLDIGFSTTDVGAVNKTFGLVALIAGSLLGGAVMARMSLLRALWIFGLVQGLSGLSFTVLALLGRNYPMLITAIAVENACAGLGTVAFVAFIMSMCDKRFTATQFALLTSVMGLSRVIGGTPTGYLAKAVGWPMFFLTATLVAVPGLLMLLRYKAWTAPKPSAGAAA